LIGTHDEALDYLRSREKFGIKFGLSNIDRIAEVLGRPEHRYPSVLIAGTNGKGSTAAILTSILMAAGRHPGRYTSPHIRFLGERIHVDGAPIPRDELTRIVGRIAEVSEGLKEPTFFEAVTATAFAYFAERNVDIAVLEVGMGGRWDATNIAPAAVSVIAPIGFGHERFLGDTIDAIAAGDPDAAAILESGHERPAITQLDLAAEAAVGIRTRRAERRRRSPFPVAPSSEQSGLARAALSAPALSGENPITPDINGHEEVIHAGYSGCLEPRAVGCSFEHIESSRTLLEIPGRRDDHPVPVQGAGRAENTCFRSQ